MSRFGAWGWMLLTWLAARPIFDLLIIAVRSVLNLDIANFKVVTPPSALLLAGIIALLAAEFYFSWRETERL